MNASPEFFVRLKDGYALRFVINVSGRHINAVGDKQATTFPDPDSAAFTAVTHGLRPGAFEIEQKAQQ